MPCLCCVPNLVRTASSCLLLPCLVLCCMCDAALLPTLYCLLAALCLPAGSTVHLSNINATDSSTQALEALCALYCTRLGGSPPGSSGGGGASGEGTQGRSQRRLMGMQAPLPWLP